MCKHLWRNVMRYGTNVINPTAFSTTSLGILKTPVRQRNEWIKVCSSSSFSKHTNRGHLSTPKVWTTALSTIGIGFGFDSNRDKCRCVVHLKSVDPEHRKCVMVWFSLLSLLVSASGISTRLKLFPETDTKKNGVQLLSNQMYMFI